MHSNCSPLPAYVIILLTYVIGFSKSDVVESLLLRLNTYFQTASMPPVLRQQLAETVINLAIGHYNGETIIEGTDFLLWAGVLQAYAPNHKLPRDLAHLMALQVAAPITSPNTPQAHNITLNLANNLAQRAQTEGGLYLPLTSYDPSTDTQHHSMAHLLVGAQGVPVAMQSWWLQHYDTRTPNADGNHYHTVSILKGLAR